ncbi:SAM-dependent DNA methyltransferase [Mucilaginibacter sp. Bleaf8]|uniref:N-6 DNA methylase n=1 Tax=Mucilaginibacter sp. Bleaf8 TaxID=2834430 RepID=UPI001BD18406|nr:N-6 DNA methylase [Mucilaginibacter sp. Bleaf8]MBS7565769.1 SAM-dependent DNA methyltransferase [Mucilaginibacter sp. Bleaf8]
MTDIKQLLTAFERFAYGNSLHTAFTDLLDWMLLPFKMHDSTEAHSAALDTYRKHKKVNELVELVKMVGDLSEGFRDPLGELYMQAISNGHNGQYFTPEPICDMMATISVGNPTDGQTVADCACGSGRMLLSAAKINRHLKLYGADLDITCCKMALVNMLLNSLQGEIAHMNSLTNDFYRGYKVSTTLVNGYHYPCYIEFTEAEQSLIWLKPVKDTAPKFDKPFEPVSAKTPINGVQGSLF